jgi:hypothetical protein
MLHANVQDGLQPREALVGCHSIMKRMLHQRHYNGVGRCQLLPTGGSAVVDKCNYQRVTRRSWAVALRVWSLTGGHRVYASHNWRNWREARTQVYSLLGRMSCSLVGRYRRFEGSCSVHYNLLLKWMPKGPQKSWYRSNKLNVVTFQKSAILIFNTVRNSDPTIFPTCIKKSRK